MTRKKNETEEDRERLRAYQREYMKARYKRDPESAREKARAWYWKGRDSERQKSSKYGAFDPRNAKPRAQRKPLTEAQKEAARERSKKWLVENRDRAKKYRDAYCKKNADSARSRTRKWVKDNPGRARAMKVEKKARKLHATPKWANRFFIAEIYDLARRRNECGSGGVAWHVDHIVPLRSKLVCGLHVEHNLRVIPAAVNMQKKNSYWPDMP